MDLPLLPIIILVIIFSLFMILKGLLSNRSEKHFEYRLNETLFSPAERSFLGVLESSIPEHTRIFGKVRVADVLKPLPSDNKSQWQTAFNKISAKHFDYVLCDSSTLEIKAVIELDDKSHNSKRAKVILMTIAFLMLFLPALYLLATNQVSFHEMIFSEFNPSLNHLSFAHYLPFVALAALFLPYKDFLAAE